MVNWEIHVEMNKGKSLFRPLIDKIRLAEIRTCYYQSRQKLDDSIRFDFHQYAPKPKTTPFRCNVHSLNVSAAGSQCQMSKGNVFFFYSKHLNRQGHHLCALLRSLSKFCGNFDLFFSPLPFSFFTFSFIYPPLSQFLLPLTLFNLIGLFVLAPFFFLV